MGTNYYRIPKASDIAKRKSLLLSKIRKLDMSPSNVNSEFRDIPTSDYENQSPWDEFIEGMNVHIGKRSSGWKFLWNFNDNKHYNSKQSLIEYIYSGRVVNEYGEEQEPNVFIEMTLTWCTDGYDLERYYTENPLEISKYSRPELYIDGLRVSDSVDFS